MAWQNPKTDWKAGDVPAAPDFNRIEGNTQYIKDEVDSHKAEDASTTAKGHVQLSSSTSSTSTSLAATASAVKTVKDEAKAYTDAHEQKAAPHSGHETPAGAQSKVDTHANKIATQSDYGHIRLADIPLPTIATQAEAEAGTNNTKMMTPLRVAQAIGSKLRVIDAENVELYINGEWVHFRFVPPADDETGSPGSPYLLAGDMQAGFFGEVSASELISGTDLASLVGISQGTSQNSTVGWLKFAWKGKILFVAKKPIRNSISWDHINSANAVYGDKTVTIDGLSYKVRLLRGADLKFNPKTPIKDQSGGGNGYNGTVCHNSEWNRLMLPIHQDAIDKDWAYPDNVESDIPVWAHSLGTGTQGRYTDADLLTHYDYGSGSYSWCQEVAESSAYRVGRVIDGVSHSSSERSSNTHSIRGWRPCLELSV